MAPDGQKSFDLLEAGALVAYARWVLEVGSSHVQTVAASYIGSALEVLSRANVKTKGGATPRMDPLDR
jgi:hypothetical protein